MNMFSLSTIIDDILLLVRNNNISESEDLSRAQIAAWILAYRAAIIKAKRDADPDNGLDEDTSLEQFVETRGPYELAEDESLDDTPLFRRTTVEKIADLLDNDPRNIISVHDQEGYPIQYMSQHRKFFHRFRKYTGKELTYEYQNEHITIHGTSDDCNLKWIWVEGIFTGDNGDTDSAEDIKIPGWMIPDIKNNILKNELAFMLSRISDDDNNSTLDGIKPQPPAASPNEK